MKSISSLSPSFYMQEGLFHITSIQTSDCSTFASDSLSPIQRYSAISHDLARSHAIHERKESSSTDLCHMAGGDGGGDVAAAMAPRRSEGHLLYLSELGSSVPPAHQNLEGPTCSLSYELCLAHSVIV